MMDHPPNTAGAVATVSSLQQSHSDSIDSSPRSRIVENWEEGPGGAKLRLMCSYGGHIIPRPHNKSLFYVGGETRMVVADRHSSLADLSARLSRTLLNGRCFALKYQIPNEDLDSLISVTTDEDLDNMIEEYDRTTTAAASPLKPTRLHLFLFPDKPETATSMGNLLEDAKSESWFVDALNGSTGLLLRGLSDSAAFDSLLNLDDHNDYNDHGHANDSSLYTDSEAQICHDPRMEHDKLEATTLSNDTLNSGHNVIHGTGNSFFGSSSSSPSMSNNLPPIRTRVDEEGVANNDGTKFCLGVKFAQLGVSPTHKKQDDGVALMSLSLPRVPDVEIREDGSEQVVSNDESSEQGVFQARFRKPPLPLQPVHYNTGAATAINFLHSPDSIASENSLASVGSLSTSMHHDPVHAGFRESKYTSSPVDPKTDISEPNSQPQKQPAQEFVYVMPPHLHQQHQPQQHHQQYIQPGAHYIHHPGAGLVQVSPYYSMYAPPPLQQVHQRMDQQIPMYTMSLTQPQNYTVGVQENSGATLGRPSTPPNAVLVAQAATTYTESLPPVYPMQKATETPQLIQVPLNQIQQQYVGFSQLHNPAQSTATANYAYEYSHPGYEQAYYTNHPASMMPGQYQTMNQSSAVYLSEAAPSPQQPTENAK